MAIVEVKPKRIVCTFKLPTNSSKVAGSSLVVALSNHWSFALGSMSAAVIIRAPLRGLYRLFEKRYVAIATSVTYLAHTFRPPSQYYLNVSWFSQRRWESAIVFNAADVYRLLHYIESHHDSVFLFLLVRPHQKKFGNPLMKQKAWFEQSFGRVVLPHSRLPKTASGSRILIFSSIGFRPWVLSCSFLSLNCL